MADSNEISGPLGIWPFPILNALVKMSNGESSGGTPSIKSWEVNRDSNGRITSVEKVEVTDNG